MLPLRDPQGRIYVSTKPVAFNNSGVAYAADGSMVITGVASALDTWNGAWRLDPAGRVVVSGGISNLLFANGEPGYFYNTYDPNSLYARRNQFTLTEFPTGTAGLTSVGALVTASTLAGYDAALAVGRDGVANQTALKAVGTQYAGGRGVISVVVAMDDGLPPVFGPGGPTGPQNDFALVLGGGAISGVNYVTELLPNGYYRVSVPAPTIAATNGNYGLIKYSGNSVRTFKTSAWQFEPNVSVASPYQKVTDWNTEYLANVPYSKIGMWQDTAKTIPVTAIGQQIALLTDNRMGQGTTPGQEMLLDPGLDDPSKWTIPGGWAVAGGLATATASGSGVTLRVVPPTPTYAVGEMIYWRMVVDSVTQGGFRVVIAGNVVGNPVIATAPGVYEGYVAATAAAGNLGVRAEGVTSGVISSISFKRTDGNKAHQPTAASRWVLSALYNIFTKSEQPEDPVWVKSGITATPRTANNWARVIPDTGLTVHRMNMPVAVTDDGSAYVRTFLLKASGYKYVGFGRTADDGARPLIIDVSNGVQFQAATGDLSTLQGVESLGDGAYRVSILCSYSALASYRAYTLRVYPDSIVSPVTNAFAFAGDGVSGIYFGGADARPLDDASPGIPPYQRVNTVNDYDTVGFPHYGKSDGVDDFMLTVAPVDFSAVSNVLSMANVTKQSDAAVAVIAESSVNSTSTPGSFGILAPHATASATIGWRAGGTTTVFLATSGVFPSPLTFTVTGISNIATPFMRLLINGTQRNQSVVSQGTGNYSSQVQYFGRRAGLTQPFNGRFYALLAQGSALPLDPNVISIVEEILKNYSGLSVSGNPAVVENAGLPFVNPEGYLLTLQDAVPAAGDPYVAGLRVANAYGVYTTTAVPPPPYPTPPPVVVNDGWNPADKDPNLALSNANKSVIKATPTGGFQSARAVQARTSGVLYFEVELTGYTSGVGAGIAAGVCDALMTLAGDPIFPPLLPGNRGSTRANGQYGNQTGHQGSMGSSFSTNGTKVWGFKVDFAARLITVFFDAVNAGGINWGAGSPAMYPFVSIDSGASAVSATVRTLASEFTLAIPPGTTPWADGT